jgi:hypothetical protein
MICDVSSVLPVVLCELFIKVDSCVQDSILPGFVLLLLENYYVVTSARSNSGVQVKIIAGVSSRPDVRHDVWPRQ